VSRTAVVTWGLALLLGIGLAVTVIHVRSARVAACAHVGRLMPAAVPIPKGACARARVEEYTTTLMAGVGAVVVVMGVALALALRGRPPSSARTARDTTRRCA
jgi:hypothetical protein